MTEIQQANPNVTPKQFRNGTWSCCARTHSRPEGLNDRMKHAYEALYPHVNEWTDDLPDATLEIIFGVAQPQRLK